MRLLIRPYEALKSVRLEPVERRECFDKLNTTVQTLKDRFRNDSDVKLKSLFPRLLNPHDHS